jgi:hypothetical protein
MASKARYSPIWKGSKVVRSSLLSTGKDLTGRVHRKCMPRRRGLNLSRHQLAWLHLSTVDLRTSLRAAVGAQWGARVGIENECKSDTEIIDCIKWIVLTVQMLCNRIPPPTVPGIHVGGIRHFPGIQLVRVPTCTISNISTPHSGETR